MEYLKEAGWAPFFEVAFRDFIQLESAANTAAKTAAKTAANTAANPAPPEYFPGRVLLATHGTYLVLTEVGEQTAVLTGNAALTVRGGGSIVAGDWVVLSRPESSTSADDFALIHELLPRRTEISRKAPGGPFSRTLAANVDLVLLTQGLDRDWNPRRMERYLALVHGGGAEPCIVMNKMDLCEPDELNMKLGAIREVAGETPVIVCSAVKGELPRELLDLTGIGRTLVMMGSSGAGKSTLINRLLGHDLQRTGGLSESHGKGRHTTTTRELILVPGRGVLIDTPGLREVALDGSADLDAVFGDIAELGRHCRFRDCSHENEPGCAVREAAERGEISEERLASYFRLSREVARLVVPRTESEARRMRRDNRRADKDRGKMIKGVVNRKRKERGR